MFFICVYDLDKCTEKSASLYRKNEKLRIELWDQSILESGYVLIAAKSYSVHLLHLKININKIVLSYIWFKLHETRSIVYDH